MSADGHLDFHHPSSLSSREGELASEDEWVSLRTRFHLDYDVSGCTNVGGGGAQASRIAGFICRSFGAMQVFYSRKQGA